MKTTNAISPYILKNSIHHSFSTIVVIFGRTESEPSGLSVDMVLVIFESLLPDSVVTGYCDTLKPFCEKNNYFTAAEQPAIS